MNVGEISFCNKIAYNIKSEDTKKFILDNLERKYKLRIIHKHYDKYNDSSLHILNKNPHMVCVRSNGNPYFLYLMKYNFIQYCVFIDKKIQQGYYLPRMIIVQLGFDDCLFEDTIFEGEMIKASNEKWYYIINDLLVCKGKQLHDVNHPKRMSLLYDIIDKHYEYEEYDQFDIGIKTYFRYNELDKMFNEYIPSLPYTCRGLYFKPLYLKFKDILYNFDDNLIKKVERIKYKTVKQFILMNDNLNNDKCGEKCSSTSSVSSVSSVSSLSTDSCYKLNELNRPNKPNRPNEPNEPNELIKPETETKAKSISEDSIVVNKKFYVRKTSTPDVYDLFDNHTHIGIACIPTLKISKKMRELTKDMNMVDRIELPFEYSNKFNKWCPSVLSL